MTHGWLVKQYRHKLTLSGMDPGRVPKFKLHSPRIIGATTLFASGKVTDMHMKAKGRWADDIAYIYARFCPDMDREAVRAMGCTDATPFMESADAVFASISGWTEDDDDLGDDDRASRRKGGRCCALVLVGEREEDDLLVVVFDGF